MEQLKIIDQREVLGKDFRIYGTPENPLFLSKDVANWIGHSDSNKMLQSVDDGEKLIGTIFLSGQNREVWFLTEDGLYEVLMQSRKPVAKEFKKQVKEILKSIRKTGGYIATTPDMTDAEIMAKALLVAQRTIEDRNKRIQSLTEENNQMKPKALFADAVTASTDTILIGELAKILKQNGVKTGQNRLFEQLRNEGYLVKGGKQKNMPTQKAMEMGLFEVKERPINNPDGSIRITKTTLVTGKGQVYFTNHFLNN